MHNADMNKLSTADRVRVIAALVEGNSIRSTVRMTGIAKNTVVKLLADVGTACHYYHRTHVKNVKASRIQCDEIWSFVGAKQKNVDKGAQGYGDIWTWTAIDADSKLVVSYMLGTRDSMAAKDFIADVASRLANRVQLTTDGHKAYLYAVERAFGGDIDYAMLVKLYDGERAGEARYSPAKCTGIEKTTIAGNPDDKHISTSFVERQNLTMRMSMRRFTRLTNAFSKKVQNHGYAVALHFLYYNFCRIHQTLRITPAMATGLSDHVWSIEEIAGLVEEREAAMIAAGALKRGPYTRNQ
jgi:IS1 family transposase